MASINIPDNWTPTPAATEALPEPLRRYIMQLHTVSDPSYLVQENAMLKQQVRELEAMVVMLRDDV